MQFQPTGKNSAIFVFIFTLLGLITSNPLFYAPGAVIALAVFFDLVSFLIALDALNASVVRKVGKTKIHMDNLLDVEVDLKINARNLKKVHFQDLYPESFTFISGDAGQNINPEKTQHHFSYCLKATGRGTYSFSRSHLDIESNLRMFRHRSDIESHIEVSIYPPVLSRKSMLAHYISTQYGSGRLRQKGMGTEVAEIRNYMPGDDVRHIDWKTSLRLNSMFTKEFESDTGLSMFVLVDHSKMDGQDNLDYAIRIANYLTQQAARDNQPTGVITFTHDRITNKCLIKSGKNPFEISRDLFSLVPETSKPCTLAMDAGEIKEFERKLRSSNGDRFHSILSPFFIEGSEHSRIMESQGIYRAIKHLIQFSKTPSLIAIITDLAYEVPVLDSVRLATYYGNRVLVIVTSPVLFKEYDVLELEEHYIEYMRLQKKIEKFKRLKSVKVMEARPGERPELIIDKAVQGWKTHF
ncbi:MAG: DUF58 domain-containing protein [Candidatus Methanoperedens sp.]|nr:DUF58 domain-containing protein [Candidatus Methanoperedens sp.]MCZ7370630.1 DUF58 domain-containing protein [Candidatus Methanoperedens sp.]